MEKVNENYLRILIILELGCLRTSYHMITFWKYKLINVERDKNYNSKTPITNSTTSHIQNTRKYNLTMKENVLY
jgi:hypothetical protein